MSIICYPLDDTYYTAKQAGSYFAARSSGVFSADGNLAVTKASATTLSVSAGLAWIKTETYWGKSIYSDAAVTLTVPTVDGTLDRICRVVVRYTKVSNSVAIMLRSSELASTPVAPSRITTDDVYELVLADYYQTHNEQAIDPAKLTDQRTNETLCGLMKDNVTTIPTETLNTAFMANLTSLQNELAQARSEGAYEAPIMAHNTTVSTWTEQATPTYEDYPFRATVAITDATSDMIPDVVYSYAQISEGIYAPVCDSYNGGVYLYASEEPETAPVIPTIILWKSIAEEE